MDIADIVIVCKESKYAYDRRVLGKSHEQMMDQYARECINLDDLITSHNAQVASLKYILTIFKGAKIVSHHEFSREAAEQAKAAIFLGGDDTFKEGTHFILHNIPIIGMNSDPDRSEGALTYFTWRDAERVKAMLLADKYNTEKWQRIDVKLRNGNGDQTTRLPPAVSEVYLGVAKPTKMSRIRIFPQRGKDEELKGSGIVIATPAGMTGLYHSAQGIYNHPNTEHVLAWVLCNPYEGKHTKNEQQQGVINAGEELILMSTMNNPGMVGIDSVDADDAPFNRGTEAKVQMSDKPLTVIRNNLRGKELSHRSDEPTTGITLKRRD